MYKKSFIFYRSYAEALKELPPEDFKKVFNAICEKALDDIDPELEGNAKICYSFLKPLLESANEKFVQKYGKTQQNRRGNHGT